MSKINLRKQTSASVSNPGTGQLSFYFDPNGILTSKDEFGTIVTYGTLTNLNAQIDAEVATLKNVPNGLASLGSDTKLTYSQSPTVNSYTANSQASMLALSAKMGEMAVRTDTVQTYILNGTDPTVLANWLLILSPAGAVSSVNGRNGAVVITKTDVGLSNVTNVDSSTTANIADSLNKRFVTDAQKAAIATVGNYTNVHSSTIVSTPVNTVASLVPLMTLSPVAGVHKVTFNGQYSATVSSITAQAAADLQTTYNTLHAMVPTVTSHPAAFGNETLTKGVYYVSAAGSIVGSQTLTLDAQGDPTALFVFQINGAFSTGASAVVTLINGALANNVFWICQGAGSIGATTTLRGTIISLAAIDIGSGSTLEGRIASSGSSPGALSCTVTTMYKPSGVSQINMGTFDSFIMFTAGGGVANTGVSNFTGNIGTNLGAISGFESSTVNGNFYTPASTSSTLTFSLYNAGVLVVDSSRVSISSVATAAASATLDAVVTTIAGSAVEVRVKIDSGTMTTGSRNFTTVQIG